MATVLSVRTAMVAIVHDDLTDHTVDMWRADSGRECVAVHLGDVTIVNFDDLAPASMAGLFRRLADEIEQGSDQ